MTTETEETTGWRFTARVRHDDGGESIHMVRLSFADYNLWSPSGSDRPEHVAAAVVRFLLERAGEGGHADHDPLPEAIHAGAVRRKHHDADAHIPGFIRA